MLEPRKLSAIANFVAAGHLILFLLGIMGVRYPTWMYTWLSPIGAGRAIGEAIAPVVPVGAYEPRY
jgi:hypothetical protein